MPTVSDLFAQHDIAANYAPGPNNQDSCPCHAVEAGFRDGHMPAVHPVGAR